MRLWRGRAGRWIVPVTGAVAAVLTVWGILGVGKASTVIPEEANSTTPDAVNESEMKLGEISGGVKNMTRLFIYGGNR